MPRYWSVSVDEAIVIQVQKSAFLLNWRQREMSYPHFDQRIKPDFFKYYSEFESFSRSELELNGINIGSCELTYINIIETGPYWSGPKDTRSVIPSFSVPECGLTTSVGFDFNCSYRFELQPDLSLHLSIRSAKLADSSHTPRLILELKGLGEVDARNGPRIESWFERAHDVIVSCFGKLTSETVQQMHWMREDIE